MTIHVFIKEPHNMIVAASRAPGSLRYEVSAKSYDDETDEEGGASFEVEVDASDNAQQIEVKMRNACVTAIEAASGKTVDLSNVYQHSWRRG